MSELHKLMKHYFDLNGCYMGNEYWSKLIEQAIKTDEAKSEVRVEAKVKPANDGEWHYCEYCGAYTNMPDENCYRRPSRLSV